MKNSNITKKISDKKMRLEKIQGKLEEEKRKAAKAQQELLALEKKAMENSLQSFNAALSQEGIDFRLIDQEQLVQLVLENQSVLIEDVDLYRRNNDISNHID